jgi:hypothetical protein
MKVVLFSIILCASTILMAQTTPISDPNFEQALIDMGYDDVLDAQVDSESIEGVTSLNLQSRGIEDLTGIAGFSNLISCWVKQYTGARLKHKYEPQNGLV